MSASRRLMGVLVCWLSWAGAGRAATIAASAGAGSGAERCLTGASQNGGTCDLAGIYSGMTSVAQLFANSQGLTLTRVDDVSDRFWRLSATNAGVFALGRSAGRDFSLGVIPVGGSFTQVLPAIVGNQVDLPSIPAGQNGNNDLKVTGYDAGGRPIFTTFGQSGLFTFAIQQTSGAGCVGSVCPDLWSSNDLANSEAGASGQVSLDHMVTWQLSGTYLTTNNLRWYVAGFENAGGLASDRDFNDYVFVFQDVAAAGVPEPGTWWLVGMTGLGLILLRKHGAVTFGL